MTPTQAIYFAVALAAAILIAFGIYTAARAMRRRRQNNWRTDMQRGGKSLGAYRTMMLIDPAAGQGASRASED